jgi:predicted permease
MFAFLLWLCITFRKFIGIISCYFPLGWLDWVCSFFVFFLLGKYGWSKLTGCLILTAGLGNTSFGPIIEALYGQEGMKTAILVDQPGTFVVLSTLGIIVATMYSKGEPNHSDF